MNPGSIEAKMHNIAGIFREIYDHPAISRRELSQRFGISFSTVTLAVNYLQERGLVVEQGQENAPAGRKARLLHVNRGAHGVLCIQITDAQALELRLCDLGGRLLAETSRQTGCGKDRFPGLLAETCAAFLAQGPESPKLAAAAVIVPGILRPDGTADLPVFGWEGVDLAGPLSAQLGVPVFCDTVIHMVGGYEIRRLPPAPRQIYLSLEPGVGMSCYEEGQLLTGRNLLCGEIGHISLREDGPVCYCGSRGCLEYYCGVLGILARYAQLTGCSQPTLEQVLADSRAQGLLQEVARDLGRALVTICNLLDPDRVVVAGRLWQVPQVRRDALALAHSRMLAKNRHPAEFLSASLPLDRWEVGVCHYAAGRLIDHLLA